MSPCGSPPFEKLPLENSPPEAPSGPIYAIAAHIEAALAQVSAAGRSPGSFLQHSCAALARERAGCAEPNDEVLLSHVLSRPGDLLVDAPTLPAPSVEMVDAEAMDCTTSSMPVLSAAVDGLPIAPISLVDGNSVVLMLLVSFLSEVCVMICMMDDSVLGVPCASDTSRSEAVRLVDQSVKTLTDTPLHSFLLGEQPARAEGTASADSASSAALLPDNSRVVCTPVPFAPRPSEVVRTPHQLTRAQQAWRLTKGASRIFMWCTLGALAGHPLIDVATQATFTCSSFVRPTADLHMAQLAGHHLAPATLLRVGAGTMHSMLREPVGRPMAGCPYALLRAHEHAALSAQHFLLSFEHPDSTAQEYVRSWGAVLPKPDFSRLPKSLLERIPSFADPALATLAFSNPCPIPSTEWLPMGVLPTPAGLDLSDPLPSGLPRLTEAWSLREILFDSALHRIQQWLTNFHEDLLQVAQGGVRQFNRVLVIGQNDFRPQARGIIWDRRAFLASGGTSPMVPMVNYLPDGQINWQFFETHLPADYPDQGLVSDIRYGVRFRAKLPLQLVLVPHLVDVNKNFDSLQAELRRLAKLGWYDLYTGIPFIPGRFHAQGLVDRKYEPGRPRRKTDAGCPRNEIFDSGGVRCPSLNEAIAESDQHLEMMADDPDSVMLVDIEQHTPPPAVNWPYECKPRLSHVEHDLAILNHLAFLTDDFVYGISDDIKDFFNHFKLAPDNYWMACLMTLSQVGDAMYNGAAEVIFAAERVLGFGYKMASNEAQRFGDAMNVILRRFMDQIEAPFLAAHPNAALQKWRQTRIAFGGEPAARRYVVHQFTDDQLGLCVGKQCLANFELAAHRLIDGLNLIMAIPIKRQIGMVLRWMGVDIYTLGVVAIPDDKATRAITLCTHCIEGHAITVEKYHSLVGQLQYMRDLLALGREAMYSLYNPFKAGREMARGPQTVVHFNDFMKSKLHAFKTALLTFMGAPVTWALPDAHRPNLHRELMLSRAYSIYTDACKTYGLGAWLHGYFYVMPLTLRQLAMPIGILEFLAVLVAFIVFGRLLRPARNIVIRTDSQPIPTVLAASRARADTMQYAHELLERLPIYAQVKRYVSAAHLYGPMNYLGDAASRNERLKLLQFCAQLRLRPQELAVPDAARHVVEQVEAYFYEQPQLLAAADPAVGPSSSSPLTQEVIENMSLRFWQREEPVKVRHTSDQSSCPDPLCGASSSSFLNQEVIEHLPLLSNAELDQLLTPSLSLPGAATRQAQQLSNNAVPKRQAASSLLDDSTIAGLLKQPSSRYEQLPSASSKRSRGAYLQQHMQLKQQELLADFSGDKAALAPFLKRAADHAVAGRKANTASVEDYHWNRYWIPFTNKIKLNPWLQTPGTSQETLFQRWLFAAFLEYVRENMLPRANADKAAKPQSSMAVLNNVLRVLERPGEQLAPRITAHSTLAGILLEHIENFGALSLVVRRKRPLTNELIDKLLQTPQGFALPTERLDWGSHTGQSVRAAFDLLADTGMRNAEIGTDEIPSMTLAHVTYWLGGHMYAHPPPGYRMKRGDYAVVVPGVAKNDPWLENFAGDAIWLEYTGPGKRCTAHALFEMDRARGVRGEERTKAPLFIRSDGTPLKSTWLSSAFYKMLCAIIGEEAARQFSIHSFRIFVATALRKAGASHALIKSLVRWKNDESVDLYGKILPADFAIWHRKIRSQRVQVLQTAQVRALAAPVAAPTFVSPAALDESQKRKPGGQLGSKRGPYMTVKRRRAMGLDE